MTREGLLPHALVVGQEVIAAGSWGKCLCVGNMVPWALLMVIKALHSCSPLLQHQRQKLLRLAQGGMMLTLLQAEAVQAVPEHICKMYAHPFAPSRKVTM